MENYSDNKSDVSLPEMHSRGVIDDIENMKMINHERDHERIRYSRGCL